MGEINMRNFKGFTEGLSMDTYYHDYQPIMNIQGSKLLGYEGLLRSIHTKSPEVLFSRARVQNQLFDLDMLSIYKAIQQLEDMPISFHQSHQHIFLNVYPSTLTNASFITVLLDLMHSNPNIFSYPKVVFEIVESQVSQNIHCLKKAVDDLRTIGFKIALDDFGKGDASIIKLMELKPDFIKMDSYFSRDLSYSAEKQKIMQYVLKYCSENNMEVVLEGIETEKDLEMAKELGVRYGQGYYLGRPGALQN